MTRPEPLRPSGRDAGAPARLLRHIRSPHVSYDTSGRAVKQPLRAHFPNLSPTRPPAVRADAAFWPAWTDKTIDELGFTLANQENGRGA